MAAKSKSGGEELRRGAAAAARRDSEDLGAHDRGGVRWGGCAAQGEGEEH